MVEVINIRNKDEYLFCISSSVFYMLFDNTIVRRERLFISSLQNGEIQLSDFLKLSRKGEVPYPLFLLEESIVQRIIKDFKRRVYFGVSKEQLSISSIGDFSLADISLILIDITRKQNYLKKIITTPNQISGRFAKSRKGLIEKADEIRDLIGYDLNLIYKASKEKTFSILDSGLSKLNVFTSLHVHNYSPQNISNKLQFSGIAINDKSCPFLFIKAGDNDGKIELWGRRIFTTALLLSCLLHSDCRPVTMDGTCRNLVRNEHYKFAEELLMPEGIFKNESCASISDVESLSTKYSVSPSAIVLRLYRLKIINEKAKNKYFDILIDKWNALKKEKGGRNPIDGDKAIIRYNNPAVVNMILQKYDSNSISITDVKHLLCIKKGELVNLEALRNV